MTVKTATKVFGIEQIMLYPILTDNSDSYSVSEGVELPGAKSIEITFVIDEKNLSGNEVILDIYSRVKKLNFTASFAKMEMEIVKNALNAVLSQKTTPEASSAVLSVQNSRQTGYFQLVAKVSDTDEGSLFLHLLKCKANSIPIKASESDFATFTLAGSGIYSTKKFTRDASISELLMDITLFDKVVETAPVVE